MPLTAAILAGGPGTRLHPVLADRPKCLAPIHGRPFLTYLLDYLASGGIRHAVLCTGYMADQVQATLGPTHGPIHLAYSREPPPLGTAGALRLALPLLTSDPSPGTPISRLASDPILVVNGDSYCPANLADFLAFHHSQNAEASLVLTRVPDISRFGQVLTGEGDPQNRITRFTEKPAPTTPPTPGLINAGIYLLSQKFLAAIPPNRPVSLEKEIFPVAQLHAFETPAPFLDIGTPASYHQAQSFFDSL
jgi:D-glycero-alpha-D-manno-heptose 1-phosphate guanylyltransferase